MITQSLSISFAMKTKGRIYFRKCVNFYYAVSRRILLIGPRYPSSDFTFGCRITNPITWSGSIGQHASTPRAYSFCTTFLIHMTIVTLSQKFLKKKSITNAFPHRRATSRSTIYLISKHMAAMHKQLIQQILQMNIYRTALSSLISVNVRSTTLWACITIEFTDILFNFTRDGL